MKLSIKKAVWQLMDKQGYASDQQIIDLIGREPLDWRTIETYKTAWKKEQYLKKVKE